MKLRLHDKVAVITGASIGSGLAIVHRLAAERVHLVMAACEPDRRADAAVQISNCHHVGAFGVAGDVGTA